MKKILLISLGLAPLPLFANAPIVPEFNSKSIGHPPLLLGDIVKSPTKPFQFDHAFSPRPPLSTTRDASRKVARSPGTMPIIEPDPAVDFKMVVATPNPAIDFKMIVKDPAAENEPAK